ncbi:MAG TPA: hypothetical protein VFW30_05655 [Bryocella sp.]|nr:hypothetical protein [Bryocella sp.]
MILERHRSTYQVRLEGMRPHVIEAAEAILRFVASIERRWMLGATETASIPLLMQINGSPVARQNRVIVTGEPLNDAPQGSNSGDIPIENAAGSGRTSDVDHTSGTAESGNARTSEVPGHSSESREKARASSVPETKNTELSSSASSVSPPMTDRAPQSTALPTSAAASQAVTPAAAAGSHEQASSAAGTPQPHAEAVEQKSEETKLDPDTVLSGAALVWTKPPSAADAAAAKQKALEAVEASLHPFRPTAATGPKQQATQVVPGTEAKAAHPPAMEHLGKGTPSGTPTASAPTPTGTEAGKADLSEQGGAPQKSAPAKDPAQEAAKKAAAEKAAEEYAKSSVRAELLFGPPPPEPVHVAPVPAAQPASHGPASAQSQQAAPVHPQAAGVADTTAPQGTAEYSTTTATAPGSGQVDLDVLRVQMLRAFARDMALEAERRGVETWDR